MLEQELDRDELSDAELEAELKTESQRFQEATGINHGLPLGLTRFSFVTNSAFLQALTELYNQGNALEVVPEEDDAEPPQWETVREFRLSRDWRGVRGYVTIYRNIETGVVRKAFAPALEYVERYTMLLDSMLRRNATSLVSAEETARENLKNFLSEGQWASYILSDCFFEFGKSERGYLIRKNRPTIAFSLQNEQGQARPLCALCLHPLGYYLNSWTGFLCPSDEALTHLLHIRSDEHYYWRKANQLPLRDTVSGM